MLQKGACVCVCVCERARTCVCVGWGRRLVVAVRILCSRPVYGMHYAAWAQAAAITCQPVLHAAWLQGVHHCERMDLHLS